MVPGPYLVLGLGAGGRVGPQAAHRGARRVAELPGAEGPAVVPHLLACVAVTIVLQIRAQRAVLVRVRKRERLPNRSKTAMPPHGHAYVELVGCRVVAQVDSQRDPAKPAGARRRGRVVHHAPAELHAA